MINILEYLELSVKKYSEKEAVIEGDSSITYGDLLSEAKKIGTLLASSKEKPVIVFMDKGILALKCFFGTVYSGNFYAMANADLPDDRLAMQCKVLNPVNILTDDSHEERAFEIYGKEKVINIEKLIKNKKLSIDEEILSKVRANHLDVAPLYANFTSGSTGVPKAVLVSHRSVIDFIGYFTKIFKFKNKDRIANQAPFDFDVSVKDIYSSIMVGATLVIVPKEMFSAPVKLLDYLCDKEVTTMTWAVSALCLITTFHGLDYKVPKNVNKILYSGEVMPMKHLKEWMSKLPKTTFVNLYGPTEITCNCTYHVISRRRNYDKGIPIGKSFPNEEIILLDDNDNVIIEADCSGEICVRGTTLALGYYNSPEQTSKSFVQNPANKMYPDIIYRTGDLGYRSEDGELFFNGRKDFQVKHMGHRIELEEVELAINAIDKVERSVVIFHEEKSKLYGFYVGDIDKKELHKILREKLPVFMVPGVLEKVEEFPLTKNGKTDRRKLLFDKLNQKGLKDKN